MEKLLESLLPEAYELLRRTMKEGDEGKPHQVAARAAFRATAAADELTDKHKYGQIPPEDSHEVHMAHMVAHEKHTQAAKALSAAGNRGTASDHIAHADKHARAAAHFGKLSRTQPMKKAANEEEETEIVMQAEAAPLPSPLMGGGRPSIGSARDHLQAAGLVLEAENNAWWHDDMKKL